MRCAPHQVAPETVVQQARIRRTDAQSHAQTQLALALVQMRAEQYEEAETTLREAITRCKQAGHLNTYISPCYAWLATILRLLACSTPRYQVHLFQERLRKARGASKTACRIARSFPADLPQSLRELAMVESLSGNTTRAVKYLRQSIQHAEKLNCPMQCLESLSFLKSFVQQLGDSAISITVDESLRLQQLTEQLSDSIRCFEGSTAVQETLSIADRFDTLLEDGRRIARSLERGDIYQQGCMAAQHLLRVQVAMIFANDESAGRWSILEKNATSAVAEVHLAQIIHNEALLNSIRAEKESRVLPWDVQDRFTNGCLLATPIRVRESIVAYLLVGHTELDNLFGSEELQVAEFIATLTGAALENAEGFEKLYKLNATLEQRVEERTAAAELRATELIENNLVLQKTEAQLRDAIEVANAANQAKGRFLATMSHEIRTPLNGILGMTQLALASDPDQQLSNYLTTIHRSGDSLLRLLNGLLDFSKIEAGKMTVESISFDPREVITDVIALLSISA
ncbi:MAG: histidine kinase dimerization/phospho-acceptor domain-containing protein, partial [Pirellula sp.]